jgi:hypothetical protein
MPGFFYDFATLKYSPSGTQLAELRFNGASNSQDGATWININNSGSMYVTGNSMYYNNYSSDFVIIKYSLYYITGLNIVSTEVPEAYILEQNYPNPFNPSTKINFGLPNSGPVSIKVFDVAGREIKILFDGSLAAGFYEINFSADGLASGLYLYSLNSNSTRITKKMIFTK